MVRHDRRSAPVVRQESMLFCDQLVMFGLGLVCKRRSLVRLTALRVMVFVLFTDLIISCWWRFFAMAMILDSGVF